MRFIFLLTLTLCGGLLSSNANAKRTSSPCDGLKPKQTVTAEKEATLKVAFGARIYGGQASGSGSQKETSVILEDQALATAYFTYQACLLKVNGVIDQATAQELVRSLMGLESAKNDTVEPLIPVAPIPVSTGKIAAPTPPQQLTRPEPPPPPPRRYQHHARLRLVTAK